MANLQTATSSPDEATAHAGGSATADGHAPGATEALTTEALTTEEVPAEELLVEELLVEEVSIDGMCGVY